MKFRNFKMIGYVVYGRGAFNQLDEILAPQRKEGKPMIFLVDHFFEGKPLVDRIPLRGNDQVIFADVTYEPKTSYVDRIAGDLKAEFGTVSGIIGIGGGSTRCDHRSNLTRGSSTAYRRSVMRLSTMISAAYTITTPITSV